MRVQVLGLKLFMRLYDDVTMFWTSAISRLQSAYDSFGLVRPCLALPNTQKTLMANLQLAVGRSAISKAGK